MDNVPTIFTAIIFFILGNITSYLYNRNVNKNLNIKEKCWCTHISDLDNIESEVADFLGYTKKQLDDKIDAQLKEIKNTFGI